MTEIADINALARCLKAYGLVLDASGDTKTMAHWYATYNALNPADQLWINQWRAMGFAKRRQIAEAIFQQLEQLA